MCGEKQLYFSSPKGSCFCSESKGGGRVGAGSRADGGGR